MGKTKWLYVLAAGAVFLLIAAIALTRIMLSTMALPDGPVVKNETRPAARSQAQVISETLIELQDNGNNVIQPPPAPKAAAPIPAEKAAALAQVPDGEAIGSVVLLRGRAHASRAAGSRRPLFEDSPVFLDEQIETVAESRLRIRLHDGTEISQGESAVMVLDQYVYAPARKDASFAMRFLKGVGRVITGKIVDLNPDGFRVRTRMATVGIRGCELVFDTAENEDRIYVFSLSGAREVAVRTTRDGTPLMNMLSGKTLPVAKDNLRDFVIDKPGQKVTAKRGIGAELSDITRAEEDSLQGATTHLAPARYQLLQSPGGARITIAPDPERASASAGAAP